MKNEHEWSQKWPDRGETLPKCEAGCGEACIWILNYIVLVVIAIALRIFRYRQRQIQKGIFSNGKSRFLSSILTPFGALVWQAFFESLAQQPAF